MPTKKLRVRHVVGAWLGTLFPSWTNSANRESVKLLL
jgi:hypothetical protein